MDVVPCGKGPETWPEIYKRSIIWDAHSCMPIKATRTWRRPSGIAAPADLRLAECGHGLQPAGAVHPGRRRLSHWIKKHPERFVLAETVADVRRAKQEGKLAIAFDLEGSVSWRTISP